MLGKKDMAEKKYRVEVSGEVAPYGDRCLPTYVEEVDEFAYHWWLLSGKSGDHYSMRIHLKETGEAVACLSKLETEDGWVTRGECVKKHFPDVLEQFVSLGFDVRVLGEDNCESLVYQFHCVRSDGCI